MIFLTTPFQLNLIKESDILFLDGTFRSAPKSYYQVFNIIGYLKEKNISLPIMSVIMKYKYEICYINLFENLKIMLYENNIDIDFSKIYLMTDFEIALRNALKKTFPDSIILGCYFHYIKSIVSKFKDYGLLRKKFLLKSYKLIFFFKLYPFLLINDKTEALNYIINNCINENNNNEENLKLKKILIYFIKNWYGTEITNFSDEYDNILKFRTNNTVERFNLFLNLTVNHFRPKLSYFFEKYKLIIKYSYNKYINQIVNINENNEESNHFIADDIYKFSLDLIEKYKSTIGVKIISQLNDYEEEELKKYLFNVLNELYSLNSEDDIDDLSEDSDYTDYLNDTDSDKNILNELEKPEHIKSELNEMCKVYYQQNKDASKNNFNDKNTNLIPKKDYVMKLIINI